MRDEPPVGVVLSVIGLPLLSSEVGRGREPCPTSMTPLTLVG